MKKLTALLALLGLGGLAYYKYKMTPEEKEKLKEKLNSAKEDAESFAKNLKENVDQKLEQAKSELGNLKKNTEEASNDLLKEAEDMYN
ncbi:YtxH domain-containing protein [Ornithobacterium rhinotracheale]|uniref:YtxH domain-containing protein n=1 Tax=Ornithobacterium rhinotracheale TaxID=28251 RepID=A0A3R5YVX2_ORNRH|nr:YtxH domain-containing protein [Ornithobacterium rhinotracheale]QAR30726.1 YtxH domain-containing protein [Ornithobacterium rhinotracheale]